MQFSCRELRSMRQAVASTFDTTATIQRNDEAGDGQGGEGEPDWVDVTTVAAAVLPATSPGDRSEGGKQVGDERRLIRLPYGTEITTANRLQVGARYYEVLAVLDDQSFPVSVDCQCKRLAP